MIGLGFLVTELRLNRPALLAWFAAVQVGA